MTGLLPGFWWTPGGAGRRSQRPQGGSSRRPHRGSVQSPACPRFGRRLCSHHGCKWACTLIGIAKDSTGRQRLDIACTTSADHSVPRDRILRGPASGDCAAVRAFACMHSDAHEQEAIDGRASGEVPCTILCTERSRCDRSSGCCSAAAAVNLNPAPKIVPPHLCYNRTTIMEREIETGGSYRRAQPEWYFARVDVARIRLAVLEVCAS